MLDYMYPILNHVGIVVSDIDQAGKDNSERFGLSGIVMRSTIHFEDALYQGKRVSFSVEVGFIELGDTAIELIQPVGSDPSPYLNALRERGEHIHHLAFFVPSIDQHLATARQVNPSLSVMLDANLPAGRSRIVYVEGLIHGALIELVEMARK